MRGDRTSIWIGALLLASTVEAQYCTWTDDRGTVHYAETCPENEEARRLQLEEPPSDQARADAQARSDDMQARRDARKTAGDTGSGVDLPPAEPSPLRTLDEADVRCPSGNRKRFVERMEAACEAERSRLIAPTRQREIDRCVAEENPDRAWCERQYADLFNPNYVGRLEPRAYDYLPECVTARVCREEAGLEDNSYRGRWYRYDNRLGTGIGPKQD